ncbi:MAG: nitrogen fixation protein NifM [Methylovulum sp.]|nr:nitrogen fixation protein NifM [Methylovulum sp.]
MTTPLTAYKLLHAAFNLFQKPPNALTENELRQAQRQARHEYELENSVLNAQEASAVMITERDVQHAYQEILNRYDDETVFLAALQSHHLDEATLREALYRQCKVEAVFELIGSRAPNASELEIGIYYHLHPEQFKQPELREVGHILISINADYPENTRAMAQQRLTQIRHKLLKKPFKFAELALAHSECPTAFQGGMLGKLPRGKLYPELEAVAFNLKVGEISELVESELGFHILVCKHIQKPEMISLQKATPKIRKLMNTRAKRTCQRAWLAALSKHAIDTTR